MDDETTAPETGERHIGRRDLLKKGAMGAGVVGVVWAAPAIEGLTLSPAYGVAASGGCHGTFLFDVKLPRDTTQHASTPTRTGCVAAITNSDWNGKHETVTSTLIAGGPGCTFNAMNFDGKGRNQFVGAYAVTNPVPGSQTISAQFVSDAGNINADLGPPQWGNHADGFDRANVADGNNKADVTDGNDVTNVTDGTNASDGPNGDGTDVADVADGINHANAADGFNFADTADGNNQANVGDNNDLGTAHLTVTCL